MTEEKRQARTELFKVCGRRARAARLRAKFTQVELAPGVPPELRLLAKLAAATEVNCATLAGLAVSHD